MAEKGGVLAHPNEFCWVAIVITRTSYALVGAGTLALTITHRKSSPAVGGMMMCLSSSNNLQDTYAICHTTHNHVNQ